METPLQGHVEQVSMSLSYVYAVLDRVYSKSMAGGIHQCLLYNCCTFPLIFVKVDQGIHDQNISSFSKTSKFFPVDQIFW